MPKKAPESVVSTLSSEQLIALKLQSAAVLASEDTWEGYKAAYYCFWRYNPAPHLEEWYTKMQAAWEKARQGDIAGVLLKAFRGANKSTAVQTFVLQKIGIYPKLSHLIVAARDGDAKKISELLADMISLNSGWKMAFPNIVPDKERGWSLAGYHVKDLTRDYSEWVQETMHDHGRDVTFMAVSAEGGAIGMHPTGCLIPDDIHDNKNTVSEVDMERMKAAFQSDVLGTMNRKGPKPCFIDIYTPKKPNDTNAMLEESGVFDVISLPAFRFDPNGKDEWDGKPITLTWPEGCTVETMRAFRKIQGSRIFRREYLLDMSVDAEDELAYTTYPAPSDEEVRGFVMHGGVDPSDTDKDRTTQMRKQSHFALAYVAELPMGGALVVDGVLEQCTQAAGERYILSAQSMFPRWTDTIVESVGYGRMWFNAAQRNPALKIRKGDLKGLGFTDVHGGDKAERLMRELYPWFENGTIRVSDKQTPFLNAVRKFFQEYKTLSEHDSAWDAMDSIYHAMKGMLQVLRVRAPREDRLPRTQEVQGEHFLAAIMRM